MEPPCSRAESTAGCESSHRTQRTGESSSQGGTLPFRCCCLFEAGDNQLNIIWDSPKQNKRAAPRPVAPVHHCRWLSQGGLHGQASSTFWRRVHRSTHHRLAPAPAPAPLSSVGGLFTATPALSASAGGFSAAWTSRCFFDSCCMALKPRPRIVKNLCINEFAF